MKCSTQSVGITIDVYNKSHSSSETTLLWACKKLSMTNIDYGAK